MIKIINIAGVSALVLAGLIVMPGEAAQKPVEPVQFLGGKIVNQLPKQDRLPESRVVRVVYPSHIAAHR